MVKRVATQHIKPYFTKGVASTSRMVAVLAVFQGMSIYGGTGLALGILIGLCGFARSVVRPS